jgi:hypothetical protein
LRRFPCQVSLIALRSPTPLRLCQQGKKPSLQSKATYELPPIAPPPQVTHLGTSILGVCECTDEQSSCTTIYPSQSSSDNPLGTGESNPSTDCRSLHTASNLGEQYPDAGAVSTETLQCRGALSVPCRISASKMCTTGSFGTTVYDGVFDGVAIDETGETTLTSDSPFILSGDVTEVTVESVTALGFTASFDQV